MASPTPQADFVYKGQYLLDRWPTDGMEYIFIDLPNFLKDLASIATSLVDESRANGPWFLFTNVDESAFDAIQCSDHELAHNCAYIYNPEAETLFLKMESIYHSTASMAITRWIERKISDMNLSDSLIFTGTTNYALNLYDEPGNLRHTNEGPLMARRKRADQAVHPFSITPPRTMEWPSLILETAYSESQSQISDDIRAWLLGSHQDIKFAMAIFVRKKTQNISIEQFELVNKPTKSISPRYIVQQTQRMTIKPPKGNQDPVIQGTFTIPFRSLFLREARGGEADLVMERDDLLRIARQVWRVKSILKARVPPRN